MSFVTSIRDYVETLNTVSETWGQGFTLTRFSTETALYILKTIQAGVLYIVSFQWIRDFTLLPIVLPKMSVSIFKETFFVETPSQVFFDFLEIPDLHQNKFVLGFFNSFFLSLPLSVVSLLSIRRLLIQGIPAGVYSIGGYLTGQIIFLICTLFGVRQILIPWLTLEPLNYVLGLVLIFRIIYSMIGEPLKELKGWFLPQYKTFFITSFILAWCEQTSIFQYLGNLTASSNVTLLESFSSSSPISSFFSHFIYILGISSGCFLFTFLWGFFFLQLKNTCLLYTPVFLSSFIQLVNKTTFVLALALSFTSIPFYGFDYLLTGPFGFVSQDTLFKNTMLDQRNEKLKAPDIRLSDAETNYELIHIDVSPFDRGEYLLSSNTPAPLSFEDLNYRGEFDWTGRSKYQGIADSRSSFFSLSKLFKKQNKSQSDSSSQTAVFEPQERNKLLSEKDTSYNPADFESGRESAELFKEKYDLPIKQGTDDESAVITTYHEISLASFPEDYLRTKPAVEKGIEQKIKDKYYSNPVYKALLTLDIDLFLNRQPNTFQLSPEQENDLYIKRSILESYYNSLRDYSNVPYSETFEDFFDGAKSFSSKVYNQQFKGTLRSVRRLFSLTVNNENIKERVLKFDQPLYSLSENQKFSPYHEELENQEILSQNDLSFKPDGGLLAKPLYAGWDEHLRKFVITNKHLSRNLAGYQVANDPEVTRNFSSNSFTKNELSSYKQGRKIKFTTWPLSMDQIEREKIPSVLLYESLTAETQQRLNLLKTGLDTLPVNVKRYEFNQTLIKQDLDRFESLAPKRGGFIWPGNPKLNFSFFSK
uniref:hypothetical protein RF1 n=1 Tax=Micractinium simplicissimum TaxID=2607983 RepID=UPI0023AAE579|nr:hypothetical protein RF1 [Micractinium simplicissimum]WCO87768.1 hypothetical protein RF1 [Micractinium simplicissimum]